MKPLIKVGKYYLWTGENNQYILMFTETNNNFYYYKVICDLQTRDKEMGGIGNAAASMVERWIKDFDLHEIPKKELEVYRLIKKLNGGK